MRMTVLLASIAIAASSCDEQSSNTHEPSSERNATHIIAPIAYKDLLSFSQEEARKPYYTLRAPQYKVVVHNGKSLLKYALPGTRSHYSHEDGQLDVKLTSIFERQMLLEVLSANPPEGADKEMWQAFYKSGCDIIKNELDRYNRGASDDEPQASDDKLKQHIHDTMTFYAHKQGYSDSIAGEVEAIHRIVFATNPEGGKVYAMSVFRWWQLEKQGLDPKAELRKSVVPSNGTFGMEGGIWYLVTWQDGSEAGPERLDITQEKIEITKAAK